MRERGGGMVAEQWYYASGDRQLGPVTREMLRSLIVTSQVRATDMVWTPGMAQWAAAQMVPELMSAGPAVQAGVVPAAMAGTPAIAYAGFWLRLVAYLIDAMVLGVLCAIAVLVVEALLGGMHSSLTPEQLVNQPTFLAEWSMGIAHAMTECVRLKPDVHSYRGNEQMSRIGG